ncbi:aldehyde dehydrogenase family protein, partial [Brevundimonas sp. NPDC055814]
MTETLELSHWIGGEKIAGSRPGESLNPSDTRQVVARTPKGGAAEVDQAVQAARAAFGPWADASPEVRSDILDRAGTLLMERREAVGRLL